MPERGSAGSGCCQYLLWVQVGGTGYMVFGSAFAYGERLTGALQINFVSLRVSHDICIKACWWQPGVWGMGGRYRGFWLSCHMPVAAVNKCAELTLKISH